MGGIFTCIDEVPDLQRLEYDMSSFKSDPVPIVWLVGAPGTGRHIQSQALAQNLGFEDIKISALLNNEAEKLTDRGKFITNIMRNPPKRIPDTLVIDLIKEALLSKVYQAKGYIMNGFPRTHKQASLFVKEIGDVDVVVFLHSDTRLLVTRSIEKRGNHSDAEAIKRSIQNYVREAKESTAKFGSKVEKIQADTSLEDVYGRIEAIIKAKLTIKSPSCSSRQIMHEL